MIFLFTDFGSGDIYVGQLKARLLKAAPQASVIDLLHDLPNFDAGAGAHLLAALAPQLAGSVTLAVVDAGVGSARRAIVMQADGSWFVGPDNGLLAVVAARATSCRFWEIAWRPEQLSHSFHGRDLFAPIAGMLECGEWWPGALVETEGLQVAIEPDDGCRIIYIDHYGNAMTGLRAGALSHETAILIQDHTLRYARVYSDVPPGMLFWYENSIGLVELAANCASAAKDLGLAVGMPVQPLRRDGAAAK